MIDRRTVTIPRSWAFSVVFGIFLAVGTLAMIGIAADRAVDRLNGLASEVQTQAERNTELLSIECDVETGQPKLIAGKNYVNSSRLLNAHCAKEKRQGEKVAGYIDTIKTDVADQLTVSEDNILARLDDVKAAVEQRPAPTVVRVPIPRPAPRTPATVAPRAAPPAPAPPPTTAAAKPPPVGANPPTTPTTCATRGKSEKCR